MRNTIVNNGWNTTEWGLAFLRVSSFPLDPSLVFEDELEFANYLAGKDTDKPYIGLLVAVKKKDSVTAKPADPDYDSSLDDANFTIYLINSTTIKDDNTIDKWNAIVLNGKDLDEIKKIIDDFKEQVKQDLDDLYDKIEGGASEEFNTLKKLQDYLLTLEVKTTQGISNLLKELDTTQIGVGLSLDGSYSADKETYYLKDATSVMNALKILDAQLKQAITSFNFRADNKDIVPLEITKQADETVISASLSFSNVDGNLLVKKADGIYNKVRLEYNKGTLTLKVNDNVVDTFNTAVTNLILEAKYDPATEAIVIVFNTEQGDPTTINIPVGNLIREWEPDNTLPTKVVELNREVVNGGGADKLSADVRLSSNTRNILVKDGNTLLVEGTSDNITYKDYNLTDVIDLLKAKDTTNDDALDKIRLDLLNEINRATQAETLLRTDLDKEIDRSTSKDTDLQNLIDTNKTAADKTADDLLKEIERAKAAEQANKDAITAETTRATTEEGKLRNDLTNEINRSTSKDDDLLKQVDTNKAAIADNTKNITANSDAIKAEVDRATEAEKDLLDKINASSVVNTVQVEDTSSVDLTATKGDTNVTLKADVRVSDEAGNMIKSKSNGLFTSSNLKYEASTNTLTYNDGNTDTVILLSAGTLVNNIVYDKSTESIIFTYTNAQGKDATINVPVADLIEEWDIQNNEDSPITLTKSRDIPGKDILTAAIKVSNTGLLQIKDGYLYVSNNATDIIYLDKTSVAEAISKEIADRTNADSLLNDKVTQEVNRATTAELKITSDLATEVNRATTEEKRLEGLITTNKTDVDLLKLNLLDEINRAVLKETELDNKINNEINRATAKEETLDNKITTETNRALQAEDELSKKIDTETNRAVTKETELESKINENSVNIQNEINRATKAEEDLQKQVDDLNETVAANFMFKSATIEPSHANVGDTVDVVLNWSFAGLAAGKEVDSQVLNGNPIDKAARTYTFKGVTKTTLYRIIATYRGMTIDTVLEIEFTNPIKLGVVDNTTIDDKILTGLKTYDDTYPIRVDCTGGKYAVLAVEHNKIQSLLINNLPLGDFTLTAVDHANGTSTTTYDVYRSNNKYNGTIILDII